MNTQHRAFSIQRPREEGRTAKIGHAVSAGTGVPNASDSLRRCRRCREAIVRRYDDGTAIVRTRVVKLRHGETSVKCPRCGEFTRVDGLLCAYVGVERKRVAV